MISTTFLRSRLAALLLLLPGAAAPALAIASPEDEARATVQATIDEVLPVLRNQQLSRDDKVAQLTEIAERRFDLKLMTGLILGRTRRQLSPPQQDEFLAEFKRHLTVTYADSMQRVRDERVEITGSRVEPNGDVTVKSRIVGGAANGVRLDYRLRSSSSTWRVIDVFIEDLSVAQNFRSQVQEIVSSSGPDRLIATLRAKNDKAEAERRAAPASAPAP
jgi:phospholipid transport system substrate-binding protein